jgi:integrase
MAKASVGTVKVKVARGRIQLVFKYGQKRYYLNLRLPESQKNLDYANVQAARIESDILACRFNPNDLGRYTPEESPLRRAERRAKLPKLPEVWERYTNFKRPQLSQTTIAVDFERVARFLAKSPATKFDQAVEIRDYLLATTTPGQAKQILKQLSACGKWAVQSGILPANSFEGLAAGLAKTKGEGRDIHPFTAEERDRVIAKLKGDRNHYAPLVEFLFRTGCRPSEAIALQQKHITSEYRSIIFEQAITQGERGMALKQGLKTQKRREFPCNEPLREFLKNVVPKHGSDYFFSSPEGKFVDLDNFTKRVWNPTLEALGIVRRSLYKTRHTFITACLDAGVDPKDIAVWVGNSPEIIYRHYAGRKKDLEPPEF